MSDITKLEHKEKMFLAGCIKTLILADGKITPAETDEINKLYNIEHFDDFETCLNEFEEKIKDEESFYNFAEEITNKDTQDIILGQLFTISIEDGVPDSSDTHIINKLKTLWDRN